MRYFDSTIKTPSYREIDFIAKSDIDSLCLCEIKLKNKYIPSIKSKLSGWTQLNKSISIAEHRYKNLSGLSICVDMSPIYGLECLAEEDSYCELTSVKKYMFLSSKEKKTIWLNSLDLSKLAFQFGLLKEADVYNTRELFEILNDPMSLLTSNNVPFDNMPFKDLKKIVFGYN